MAVTQPKRRQRSQCDTCPSKSRLHRVLIAGRRHDICLACLAGLRRLEAERAAADPESSEEEPPIPADWPQ